MALTGILHRQWTAVPVDDSTFDTAPLVFSTEFTFDAPPKDVWDVLDGDAAWEWLPFPGTGVRYPSPERGVGIVREMGSVYDPFRVLWVEREQFWRYEPLKRITFGVVSGNWMQFALVRQYAEDVTFHETADGGTHVVWTVAINPRAPFRFVKYVKPVWRTAYRIGFGPGMRKRLAARSSIAAA
ncbi:MULTISPECIES: SRPBCC family protein [unclassified Mycobacterium]|uniref:SRPBCC family protein n=1 Tax=unclassified Mycobacterium TaxID=2642494 RepID=UPI0009E9F86F|nr:MULTISPECIES: SRPBCC family protein [unclassified Mycobacterium]